MSKFIRSYRSLYIVMEIILGQIKRIAIQCEGNGFEGTPVYRDNSYVS